MLLWLIQENCRKDESADIELFHYKTGWLFLFLVGFFVWYYLAMACYRKQNSLTTSWRPPPPQQFFEVAASFLMSKKTTGKKSGLPRIWTFFLLNESRFLWQIFRVPVYHTIQIHTNRVSVIIELSEDEWYVLFSLYWQQIFERFGTILLLFLLVSHVILSSKNLDFSKNTPPLAYLFLKR